MPLSPVAGQSSRDPDRRPERTPADGLAPIAALLVCAASNVVVGRALGYTSIPEYATFWLAALLAVCAGWLIARALGQHSGLDLMLRTAMLAVAIVIGCAMAAGAAGRLTTGVVLAGQGATAAAAAWFARRASPPNRVPGCAGDDGCKFADRVPGVVGS